MLHPASCDDAVSGKADIVTVYDEISVQDASEIDIYGLVVPDDNFPHFMLSGTEVHDTRGSRVRLVLIRTVSDDEEVLLPVSVKLDRNLAQVECRKRELHRITVDLLYLNGIIRRSHDTLRELLRSVHPDFHGRIECILKKRDGHGVPERL